MRYCAKQQSFRDSQSTVIPTAKRSISAVSGSYDTGASGSWCEVFLTLNGVKHLMHVYAPWLPRAHSVHESHSTVGWSCRATFWKDLLRHNEGNCLLTAVETVKTPTTQSCDNGSAVGLFKPAALLTPISRSWIYAHPCSVRISIASASSCVVWQTLANVNWTGILERGWVLIGHDRDSGQTISGRCNTSDCAFSMVTSCHDGYCSSPCWDKIHRG